MAGNVKILSRVFILALVFTASFFLFIQKTSAASMSTNVQGYDGTGYQLVGIGETLAEYFDDAGFYINGSQISVGQPYSSDYFYLVRTSGAYSCGTTINFYAYGVDYSGQSNGQTLSFVFCAPLVLTNSASNVAPTSATLNANMTTTGGLTVTTRGFAYGTTANLSTSVSTTTNSGSYSAGVFTEAISSLSCGTYYARAYATNSQGTEYGSVVSFTTSTCPQTVTTSAASSVTATTATLNGDISATGGANATQSGFAYGTSATLATTIATSTLGTQEGAVSFTEAISSLTCNTTYYARAYATNTGGTSYGSIESFTTTACAPTLTTDTASSLSTTGATLNGTISATGGANATQSGFAYGTSATLATTIATSTLGAQEGVVSFTESISSLTCNTTYYARAYATNTGGTSYGSIESFTTTACAVVPSVTANSTPITSTPSGGHGYVSLSSLSPELRAALGIKLSPFQPAPIMSIAPTISNTVSSAIPPRYLTYGTTNFSVKILQIFLNTHKFPVATLGAGSSGRETTYFGPATKATLIKFQKFYGLPATGYFGPMTMAVMKQLR